MRRALLSLSLSFGLAAAMQADEAARHRFDSRGAHQPQGYPEQTPKILAVAGKPMTLHFSGLPTDWHPVIHIHRVTAARRIAVPSVGVESTKGGWRITWTPPETRGLAQYEIRLQGEPVRVVRIETRDQKQLAAAREDLSCADWEAQGLTAEERNALAALGILTKQDEAATASLEIRPRKGVAPRRRIVWDKENTNLLVWHPGSAAGDMQARAPRWWISPAALATDEGLIRFLDLFSEPQPNP